MEHPDVTIFKALAVEPRARIVSLLCGRCLCAGALARLLEITPGAVSQHLNVLKECGLVVVERRGNFMHYRIAPDAEKLAREALDALFAKPARGSGKSQACTKTCSCPRHAGPVDAKQPHTP